MYVCAGVSVLVRVCVCMYVAVRVCSYVIMVIKNTPPTSAWLVFASLYFVVKHLFWWKRVAA